MEELISETLSEGLFLALIFSAIPLGTSLIVGLSVSIFQAATQIGEHTLSFVPKLGAVVLVLFLFGGDLLLQLESYARNILMNVGRINLP